MAPKITQLAGEAKTLFENLTQKLSERTGPLSPEATESLKRLSPDEQVALDEFLSQGGQIGEVSGTGAERLAAMYPDPDITRAGPEWEVLTGPRQDTTPYELDWQPTQHFVNNRPGPWGTSYEPPYAVSDMQREAIIPGNTASPAERRNRVWTAQDANRVQNEDVGQDPKTGYRNNATGWPTAWKKWENIPGIAAGAVGAGVLLGSGEAEAGVPRKVPAEMRDLGGKLTKALAERTGTLADSDIARAVSLMSPDEQVALDELLEGGAQWGEVQGTGLNAATGIWPTSTAGWASNMGATLPYASGSPPEYNIATAVESNALATGTPMDDILSDAVGNRVEATQLANVGNRQQNAGRAVIGGWPAEWARKENIPGVAGALTVGGLLASQRAEAATKQEQNATLQSKARPLTQQEIAAQQAQAKAQAEINRKSPNPKVRGAQLLKDAADGNLQMAPGVGVGDALANIDKHIVKPLQHFTQFAWQQALYGGPSPELQESIARDLGTEKYHKPEYVPYDQNKPGEVFRQVSPEKALVFERFFKHIIGPTDWNTGDPSLTWQNLVPGMKPGKDAEGNIERLHPAARAVIERMGERHGPAATASVLSLTQWGRDLPFWLLPASDAAGSIASQAVLGAVGGMVDPESTAEMGAVAGAGFGLGGKAVGALIKKIRGPKVDVVSIMDPEGSTQLIESMARTISGEQPAVAPPWARNAPMVVADLPDGRMAALVTDQKGIVQTVEFKGKVPENVPHITSTGQRVIAGEVDDFKGMAVIVKDGKMEMHHVDSDDLKVELFKARKPVEVTMPDGTTKFGFIVAPNGDTVRVGMAPGERLPGGLDAEVSVDPKAVRPLDDKEATGLALLQADRQFEEEVFSRVAGTDTREMQLAAVLNAAHAETGGVPPVIPSKTLPSGSASQAVIDAEFSVINGGGVPPGLPGLPSGPLPDVNPKLLPATGTPANDSWKLKNSWVKQVWGMFLGKAKMARDAVINPVHTTPEELQEIGFRQASLHTFEELRKTVHDSILDQIPGYRKMSDVERKQLLSLINQYVNGTLSKDGLGQFADGALNQKLLDYLETRRLQLRTNEQYLTELKMRDLNRNIDPLDPNYHEKVLSAERGPMPLPKAARDYWDRVEKAGGSLPDYIRRSIEERKGQGSQKAIGPGVLEYVDPRTEPLTSDIKADEFYEWAPRIYLSKLLPEGEWAKTFRKDKRRYSEARSELFKLLKEKNREWDDTVLWAHSEAWLEDLIRGGEGSIHATASLRPRLPNLPMWLRDALGEIDNGIIRLADAESRQQHLIHRGLIYKAIAENPTLSVRSSSFDLELQRMGWKTLEGNYGLATGMRVRPDVYELLTNLPDAMAKTKEWHHKLATAMKWNFTVGNPATWALNVIGNGQSVLMSNLINPFNPLHAKDVAWATVEALEDLVSLPGHKSTLADVPSVRTDPRSRRLSRAMDLGVLGSDSTTAEFRDAIKEWHIIVKKASGDMSLLDHSIEMMKKPVRGLSKAYGGIDPMFKYFTWIGGLKRWGIDGMDVDRKKAIKALEDLGVLKGMMDSFTPEQQNLLRRGEYSQLLPNAKIRSLLEVAAAKRIHESFPMVDRLGDKPSKIARSALVGPVFNMFFRTGSEMLRVWGTLPKRIASEPGFALNMIPTATFILGLGALVKYQQDINGVDQEYIDAVWQSATPSQRKFRPGAMAMWYRNEDGSLDFIDFTRFVEPLRYLVGSPEDHPVKRVVTNLLGMPFNGTPIGSALQEGAYNFGLTNDKPFITDPAEWQRSPMYSGAQTAARLGLIPGTFSNIYRAMERGGIGFEARTSASVRPVEPQPKWMSFVNSVMGGDFLFRLGTPRQISRAKAALRAEESALRRQLNALYYKREGQSTGPLTIPLDRRQAIEVQKAAIREKRAAVSAALEKLNSLGGSDDVYSPEPLDQPTTDTFAPEAEAYEPEPYIP